jgi:hypothetical protein
MSTKLDESPADRSEGDGMSTETNRDSKKTSSVIHTGDLKASDFFPPGVGWNKSERPSRDIAWEEVDKARTEREKTNGKH